MTSYDNFKKATLTAVVAAVLSLGLSLPASATLIGDTITITTQANVPLDTWSDSVLVGAGIELLGIENPAGLPPYPDNLSPLQHVNAILGTGEGVGDGAIFPHLFAGDFYDIGESSITIHYEALGNDGFEYGFNTDFLDLDWTDTPGTLQNVTLAPGAMGLVAPPNFSMITPNSFRFQATVDLVAGAHFTLNLTAVHIPEPSTMVLAGIALLGMSYRRRRRA